MQVVADVLNGVARARRDEGQEVADHRAIEQAVRQAIASLPPRYRDAIILQVFHELTYEQIATALSLPLSTADFFNGTPSRSWR